VVKILFPPGLGHAPIQAARFELGQPLKKGKTMPTATSNSKVRNIVSNILIFLPSIALLASSITKFAHLPAIVAQMTAVGFTGPRLMVVAVLEFASAVLFLVPKSRPIGLLLVSAYLGGAVAAQLGHGLPPEPPAVLLALLWTGTWLKKSAITT
jgi:hypothetical protein